MSIPKNMWECPNCGDYIDNYHKTCPRCNKSKEANKSQTSSIYRPSLSASSSSAVSQPSEQYEVAPVNPHGESWAASFMKGIAIFLWIGGLIVAIVTSRDEVIGYYSTYTEFNWVTFFTMIIIYGVAGGFAFCLSELFENIQRIANSLQRMNVTKK